MKKIIIAMFALPMAVLFLPGCKNKHAAIQPAVIQSTLNGVDKATALRKIANFESFYERDTAIRSATAWYDTAQIRKIYNLLIAESAANKADGLRLYFACDSPSSNSTQLKLSILLVSTYFKAQTSPDSSTHRDYYDHADTGGFLRTPTGIAVNDSSQRQITRGALLYDASAPQLDVCSDPTTHYINDSVAHAWVQRRCERCKPHDNSVYNTCSEWYRGCFILSLFKAVLDPKNKLDGLRIYIGKGYIDKITRQQRDVFIWVPTHPGIKGVHTDYYHCLEEVDAFCGGFKSNERGKAEPFGGYDNGELCPTNCD